MKKKIEFKLEIEINSNKNNIFTIMLKADNLSYLNIKAIQKNSLFNKSFSNKFTFDEIKENKYFFMFEDLKEICEELSNRIKTKELKLIENAEDLVFIVSLPTTKIKEITFELKEEQKDNNDKINTLNELIIKLKDEIREIKDENKKEINELKNNFIKKINELKNEINDKIMK